MQIRIKSYNMHPVGAVCITLLITIICLLLFSGKPAEPVTPVTPPAETESSYDWHVAKDYQLELTIDGKYAIMYDDDRVVGVLPLDNKCNLTNLIMLDND